MNDLKLSKISELIKKHIDYQDAKIEKEESYIKTSLQDVNKNDFDEIKKYIIKTVYSLNPYLAVRVEIYELWKELHSLEIYFTPVDIPTT